MKKERLKPGFIDHYRGFKRGLEKHERLDPANKIFNDLLHDLLISKQKISFLPSKEYMSEECVRLAKKAEYLASLNGAQKDRLDFDMIDRSLENMDFLPIMRKKEGDDTDNWYLFVIGLIPLKGLTHREQSLLSECFNLPINEDEGVLQITLMNAKVSSFISEEKQNLINLYLRRIARSKFNKFAISRGEGTSFKYGWWQKLKDFWLDGGI